MTTPAQSILFEKVVVRHGKMGKAKLRPSLGWQSRARGALGTLALPGFLAQASPAYPLDGCPAYFQWVLDFYEEDSVCSTVSHFTLNRAE